ncbi:hypothetical protein GFS24_20315 [Chitinophaga sp. SYP-B3965]|uniref:P-loop NTPase fold protein n=1 Tax=Chitinophaga sp. SYP-B3965 TaxID=2663120 RepID=UPI001299B05E|nr:P-loop NTPase fold protein [Chitinophaga sp. SYP-B3965]MRG47477.1 hypothetical protein [Chitinophaga sp. SYP-B3965]
MEEKIQPSQFTDDFKEVITQARSSSIRLGNSFIDNTHFLIGMCETTSQARKILERKNIEIQSLVEEISKIHRQENQQLELQSLPLTIKAEQAVRGAALEARQLKVKRISSIHMLLSILKNADEKLLKILFDYQLSYAIVLEDYSENLFEFSDENDIENVDKNQDGPIYSFDIEKLIQVSMRENTEGVLGVSEESAEIAKLLINLHYEKGMMFGLFGQWGRGKTFFWQNIWNNVSKYKSKPFYKVEFHAWKYQDTPATWAYLYECLTSAYYKKPQKTITFSWFSFFYKLIYLNFKRKGIVPFLKFLMILLIGIFVLYVNYSFIKVSTTDLKEALLWLGVPSTILITTFSLIQIFKKTFSTHAKDLFLKYGERHNLSQHLGLQAEIQSEIQTLLKAWIPEKRIGKKRLLLFIDDIDRCNESKILQIIDSLRIMLDDLEIAKRTVVIAAIDERILKLAISQKYLELVSNNFTDEAEKSSYLESIVREYMDKLFIGGIKLRILNKEERRDLLLSMVKGKIKKQDKIDKAKKTEQKANENALADDHLKGNNELNEDLLNYIQETITTELQEETNQYELEWFELDLLIRTVEVCNRATPRNIRIFYYRYLLGKRYLAYSFLKDKKIFSLWNSPANDKSIFPLLIMHFSIISNPEKIEILSRTQLHGNSETEIELFSSKYRVDNYLLDEILKVIEVIVPY